MADPITWRNVAASSSPSEAAKPLAYAGQSLNLGFENLRDILSGVESTDKANWNQTKKNNTQDFLDKLAAYKTPEELAAARATGELANLRQGFGAQIDREQVRGAEENRVNWLRDNLLKEQAYGKQQNELAHQPLADAMKAALLRGDTEAANQIATNFPNMPQLPELLQSQRTLGRQNTVWGREDAEEAFKVQKRPKELAEMDSKILTDAAHRALFGIQGQSSLLSGQASLINAQNNKAQMEAAAEEKEANRVAKQQEKARTSQKEAYELLRKDSGMTSGTLDTEEGKKAFIEGLKERKVSESQANDILYNLNKYYADGGIEVGKDAKGNPIRMPIPVTDALKAVERSGEGDWKTLGLSSIIPGWSRRGDDFANILDDRFKHGSKNQDKSRIDQIKGVIAATQDRLSPLSSSFAADILNKSGAKKVPSDLAPLYSPNDEQTSKKKVAEQE